MATWLSRARAYACPMRSGSGIKNKLLEALANGLPSVVTPRALAGLDVTAGRHLLVGEDEEQLAAHLARVLADDALAGRLSRAGREYVEQHHSWAAVGSAYEDVYEQALSAAR
jgi:glycosyltransferase involved in cell wall biosynthesis